MSTPYELQRAREVLATPAQGNHHSDHALIRDLEAVILNEELPLAIRMDAMRKLDADVYGEPRPVTLEEFERCVDQLHGLQG